MRVIATFGLRSVWPLIIIACFVSPRPASLIPQHSFLPMAIEFHCPYCTAVMRVPDEFAAKQGRCPKCDTIVVVPDVRPPEVVAAAKSTAAAHSQNAGSAVTPTAQPESPSADPLSGLVPVQRDPSIASSLRKKSRRRGPQRVWLVGVPVIFFLILIAAIGWYVVTRLPALSGQLSASLLNSNQLPPTLISWSAVSELSEEQVDALRSELELAPEAFVSTQMRCQLTGTEDGIEIDLRTTEETAWYVVDPNSHAALVLWLRKNRDRLSTQRNIRFQNSLRQYCRDKMQVIDGTAGLIDAEKYRNSVGLDGSCAGFGSVVEVVVSNRVIRCAAEDEAGRLYFCLPRGVVNFQLRGRTLADGTTSFPGQFDVSVDGTIEAAAEPSDADEETDPDDDNSEGSVDDQSTEMEEPDNSEPSGESEQD